MNAAHHASRYSSLRLWGASARQLHDRFWASRGVQVVRHGQGTPISDSPALFMLTSEHGLALFELEPVLEALGWLGPRVAAIVVQQKQHRRYREQVLCDTDGRCLSLQRQYGKPRYRRARVALTAQPQLAQHWSEGFKLSRSWRVLRRSVPDRQGVQVICPGGVFVGNRRSEVRRFFSYLLHHWEHPEQVLPDLVSCGPRAWAHQQSKVATQVRMIGPVWIGRGRRVSAGQVLAGPALLWDRPPRGVQPPPDLYTWAPAPVASRRQSGRLYRSSKRLFDIAFSFAMLLCTLPWYPLIMLAIWADDGPPFFFGHRRQGRGGELFVCWKFRSMRKNADTLKNELATLNQADGPQFFIEHDPRLTRVGRWLRKFNIDEWPQFFNVLQGQMSVVGPRPSPDHENQFCPAWREARLSVRPGITGLWQVRRSRKRGLDFQEWVRYDVQYADQVCWRIDLWILLQTALMVIRGRRSAESA